MMLRYLIRFNLLLPDARALVTESQLRSKIEPETNGNRKKREQVENNSLTGKDETMLSIVWIIVSFLVSIFLYHRLQTSILWIWCTVGRFLCVCRIWNVRNRAVTTAQKMMMKKKKEKRIECFVMRRSKRTTLFWESIVQLFVSFLLHWFWLLDTASWCFDLWLLISNICASN